MKVKIIMVLGIILILTSCSLAPGYIQIQRKVK
ncbi:lipoprotein [Vallitalea guaymasensis]|nr:lipoprotein [Vallitalea guaymasensis]